MPNLFSNRRRFLKTTAVSTVSLVSGGCGTVLYPERMGQRRGTIHDVDWTIAGMDAIGLVFFFVPGVIAFAIDFQNGTLFYPTHQRYAGTSPTGELQQVDLEEQNPSLSTVEQAVAEETGEAVELREGNFFSRRLNSIKEFWLAKREFSDISSSE